MSTKHGRNLADKNSELGLIVSNTWPRAWVSLMTMNLKEAGCKFLI